MYIAVPVPGLRSSAMMAAVTSATAPLYLLALAQVSFRSDELLARCVAGHEREFCPSHSGCHHCTMAERLHNHPKHIRQSERQQGMANRSSSPGESSVCRPCSPSHRAALVASRHCVPRTDSYWSGACQSAMKLSSSTVCSDCSLLMLQHFCRHDCQSQPVRLTHACF